MSGSTNLIYERLGPRTWVCHYEPLSRWPFRLWARNVYPGTGRLLADLSYTRVVEGGPKTQEFNVLTEHLDLMIISRQRGFSKNVAHLLKETVESGEEGVDATVGTMLRGLQEKLIENRGSIEIVNLLDIPLPKDLTPPYAVWPLVPKSRPGMLVAPSGTGKSAFALLVGLSVATGKILLPRIEPRSEGPVLYVGQEDDRDLWASRVAMICRGHQIESPNHYFYVRLSEASLPTAVDRLAEAAAVRKAQLVIVDSAQATWGTEGEGSVRGYATHWFNALAEIGVPVLVIEHPNLVNTMKGNATQAAGAGVKQDRVGHQWGMRSIALPVRDGQPFRSHVTLTDVKRNYVAIQNEINYELMIFHYDWMRFVEAETLTASSAAGVDSGSRMADALVAFMADPKDDLHEEGWPVAEAKERMNMKDDRRIRDALMSEVWHEAKWSAGLVYRFEQVEDSGTSRTNPARFKVVTKPGIVTDPVQLSMAPGDPDEPN